MGRHGSNAGGSGRSGTPALMDSPFVTVQSLTDLTGIRLIDCRFRLNDPEWGEQAFAEAHGAGAVYAHLDRDLADLDGGAGRHPLPDMAAFHENLTRWGVRQDQPTIVYDDSSGAIAARLWWLMRYTGYSQVAILDGGWNAWEKSGLPVESGLSVSQGSRASLTPGAMTWVGTDFVRQHFQDQQKLLLDARSRERFLGKAEPIDPVAGCVPGARNRPFEDNLTAGRLKPREELKKEWISVLGDYRPDQVVHMCGSGVTACFNLACMEYLGMSGSTLYVDSWSGWIEDADNPVFTAV